MSDFKPSGNLSTERDRLDLAENENNRGDGCAAVLIAGIMGVVLITLVVLASMMIGVCYER